MKYISCWLLTIASVIFLGACSEESTPPTSLDESSITTQSGPGSVTIYWDIPDEANYYYVRVNYSTPDDGDCMKTASIYSDSLLIDNLHSILEGLKPLDEVSGVVLVILGIKLSACP